MSIGFLSLKMQNRICKISTRCLQYPYHHQRDHHRQDHSHPQFDVFKLLASIRWPREQRDERNNLHYDDDDHDDDNEVDITI